MSHEKKPGLLRIIERVHSQVAPHFDGTIWAWVNKEFDGGYTKLLDQFEAILAAGNEERADAFADVYIHLCLFYIAEFKKAHGRKETLSLFERLQSGQKLP
jgi:hypothetical protein